MQYMLLTNVAGEKLRFIVMPSQGSLSADSVAESLLPPAQNFPKAMPIETVQQNFLALTLKPQEKAMQPNEPTFNARESMMDFINILNDYHLFRATEDDPSKARVPLILSSAVNSPDIFSISLRFSTTASFGPIAPIIVPMLSGQTSSSLHTAEVVLLLTPVEPMPALLQVTAEYALIDGRGCTVPLSPLSIPFLSLCLPVVLPPAYAAAGQRQASAALFDQMWQEMYRDGNGEGVSVKVLHTTPQVACASLTPLVPFLVRGSLQASEGGSGGSKGSLTGNRAVHFMIFVPPQHHVLLNVVLGSSMVTFRMATDNVKVLPHVDTMLSQLFNDSQAPNDAGVSANARVF